MKTAREGEWDLKQKCFHEDCPGRRVGFKTKVFPEDCPGRRVGFKTKVFP